MGFNRISSWSLPFVLLYLSLATTIAIIKPYMSFTHGYSIACYSSERFGGLMSVFFFHAYLANKVSG